MHTVYRMVSMWITMACWIRWWSQRILSANELPAIPVLYIAEREGHFAVANNIDSNTYCRLWWRTAANHLEGKAATVLSYHQAYHAFDNKVKDNYTMLVLESGGSVSAAERIQMIGWHRQFCTLAKQSGSDYENQMVWVMTHRSTNR